MQFDTMRKSAKCYKNAKSQWSIHLDKWSNHPIQPTRIQINWIPFLGHFMRSVIAWLLFIHRFYATAANI